MFRKHLFLLLLILISITTTTLAQGFDDNIKNTSDSLAKKIINWQGKTVAVADFINLDGSITQLGVFLSSEISFELSNRTNNQKLFKVMERSKLEQIFKEKKLIQSNDGSRLAKDLGKLDVADILIFATITDFEGYYRVNIGLLDTRNGEALGSFRTSFVKSPSLEKLNQTVKVFSTLIPQQAPDKKVTTQVPQQLEDNKGDVCFILSDSYFPPQSARITIFKTNSDEIEKIIDATPDGDNCIHEIRSGVHKVKVEWSLAREPQFREIKIKAGDNRPITFKHH